MTVKELIDQLSECDPNRLVVIAKDSGGNGYSPLWKFWEGAYRADTTYSGEMGLEKLTPEDENDGYSEEDVIRDGVPAIVLKAVN